MLFSIGAVPIYIPTNSAIGFPFHQSLSSIYLDFLMMAMLTDIRWCLVVLISNSLIITDLEHIFMCLIGHLPVFWERCLFCSFAHFLIEFFVFLVLSCLGICPQETLIEKSTSAPMFIAALICSCKDMEAT